MVHPIDLAVTKSFRGLSLTYEQSGPVHPVIFIIMRYGTELGFQ